MTSVKVNEHVRIELTEVCILVLVLKFEMLFNSLTPMKPCRKPGGSRQTI
jgi:hypothetical protein